MVTIYLMHPTQTRFSNLMSPSGVETIGNSGSEHSIYLKKPKLDMGCNFMMQSSPEYSVTYFIDVTN